MKMDVERFECRILEGMDRVAKHIDVIQTERTQELLHSQGWSGEGLVKRLQQHGFATGVNVTKTVDMELVARKGTGN